MSKVCTLSEAVSKYVKNGDHIVMGVFYKMRYIRLLGFLCWGVHSLFSGKILFTSSINPYM